MTNNAQTRNGCAPLVAECIKGTKLLVFIFNEILSKSCWGYKNLNWTKYRNV